MFASCKKDERTGVSVPKIKEKHLENSPRYTVYEYASSGLLTKENIYYNDELTYTNTYSYQGNKISKIEYEDRNITYHFTYFADSILVEYSDLGSDVIDSYSYLVIHTSGNKATKYINYQKVDGKYVASAIENLEWQGNNVSNIEVRFLDNWKKASTHKSSISDLDFVASSPSMFAQATGTPTDLFVVMKMEYDSKINPFYKSFNFFRDQSINNIIYSDEDYSNYPNNTTVYEYEYNEFNLPVKQTSTSLDNNSKIEVETYIYE